MTSPPPTAPRGPHTVHHYLTDVPAAVVDGYVEETGIARLHAWQSRCLEDTALLAGGNVVVSVNTAGGKSLVAEVALLRAAFRGDGGVAVYVLPFLAMVSEKAAALAAALGHHNATAPRELRCPVVDCGDAGSAAGAASLGAPRALVLCTPEAALGLADRQALAALDAAETRPAKRRRAAATAALGNLRCVAVDELHMVGDAGRGAVYEKLLARLRFVAGEAGAPVQVVGLSATLSNGAAVAAWLGAAHAPASRRAGTKAIRRDFNRRAFARFRRRLFAVSKEPAERTRSVQTRPNISRIDFDVTELERFEVFAGRGVPLVVSGTGEPPARAPEDVAEARGLPGRRARRRRGPRARGRGRRRPGPRVLPLRRRPCATQIFNPTSTCAYETVSPRALPPCFESSPRAFDPSKSRPNRLRFDRARAFQSLVGTSRTGGRFARRSPTPSRRPRSSSARSRTCPGARTATPRGPPRRGGPPTATSGPRWAARAGARRSTTGGSRRRAARPSRPRTALCGNQIFNPTSM